uniref:Uncharacterized protein n=1 Tax=Megaselia scalaris TaxID=36166 RepID=T1H0A9_MEGSC
MRASEPINNKHIDNIHKSWGSVDNIPQTPLDDGENMPPPKLTDPIQKKKRSKRGTSEVDNKSGYSSMPTTPNQPRSTSFGGNEMDCEQSDSDSACGFGSNWSVGDSGNKQTNNFPNYV